MNSIGIIMGRNSIENPAGLIINNLPFLLCVIIIGIYGPGAFALSRRRP